jgi:transporter family protein
MAGIIAFVFALSHGGKASIVVPMTAMYPVVTIGLSVAILKEQITPTTGLGIVFALIAVFLLSR